MRGERSDQQQQLVETESVVLKEGDPPLPDVLRTHDGQTGQVAVSKEDTQRSRVIDSFVEYFSASRSDIDTV